MHQSDHISPHARETADNVPALVKIALGQIGSRGKMADARAQISELLAQSIEAQWAGLVALVATTTGSGIESTAA